MVKSVGQTVTQILFYQLDCGLGHIQPDKTQQILVGIQNNDSGARAGCCHSQAKQIIAACVPAGDGVTVPALTGFLAGRLPDYMIPALWAIVPELPLTANGKIDRGAIEGSAKPSAMY